MRVLNVNISDNNGGAGKAAFRLHLSLLEEGIDSILLVQNKYSTIDTVLSSRSLFSRFINSLRWRIITIPLFFYSTRTKRPFSTSFLPKSHFFKLINRLSPDIVHLHWIAGGMMQIEELSKIKAPIVWTLHDCWPFTGGCHVNWSCVNYINNCGCCPVLNSSNKFDLSNWIYKRKLSTYSEIKNVNFIGVSNSIADSARKSKLIGEKNIVVIPNLIDTDIFFPLDKSQCRIRFDLDLKKKVILFGAYGADIDENKGMKYFLDALKYIKTYDFEIVVFGNSTNFDLPANIKIKYLGILEQDSLINTVYNLADVMVIPSIQESFGQTAMESMACGVPVVCFDTSGLKDIVDHLVNGYRAECFCPKSLSNGINWVLDNAENLELSKKARSKVMKFFNSKVVSLKYIAFYNEVLLNLK